MQPISRKATATSPAIRFDPREATLSIEGESYPENSFEFYEPVLVWLEQALKELGALNLAISVSYMNSSSTKCMLDLLDLLEEAHGRGVRTRVTWFYDAENPRSLDLAEEFQEEVTFDFTIEPLAE